MYRPAFVLFITMYRITTATAKMRRPTGKSPTLTRFRNQPLPDGSLPCGQLTDCVFVKTEPRPLAMFMVAMETMKGGTPTNATRYPLKQPKQKPITMLMIRETTTGAPWVFSV